MTRSPRQHPRLRIAIIGVAAAMLPPMIVAMIISKLYWGYFVMRPTPSPGVMGATQVVGISALADGETNAQYKGFIRGVRGTIIERIDDVGREGGYYNLEQRALIALQNRGIDFIHAPELTDNQIATLNNAVESSDRIQQGSPSYKQASALHGYAMQFSTKSDLEMYFVAVRGRQVSNDHYPYYEFVFRKPPNQPLELQSFRMFYFDIAGFEHGEWFIIAMGLGIFWTPPVLLVVLLVLAAITWRDRRRRRASCCRTCGYPIGSSPVCTECGSNLSPSHTDAFKAERRRAMRPQPCVSRHNSTILPSKLMK
jgi:hypothetical protein